MIVEKRKGLNWVVAAGIVGADIGTSIFYGTGILFPIVGYLAPVFVLTTCLMMWLFKRTYEEGLALSPYNGGAYSMILRTLGRRVAVLAGTLTFVSYLATAAVSALSGGLYILSLFGPSEFGSTVVLLACIPIILFGILNSKGIDEPAKIVTVIAGVHFALLIIMVIWGTGYIFTNFDEINFSKLSQITPSGELSFAMLMYGFAAGFLGITGFESAAQIVEELEGPALETVRKLYKTVIILVSLTAPAISFLCLIILTQDEVNQNLGSLLSKFAETLGGKFLLTVIVVDATLTLFAAVNTAFVGFIGLATTMAKQGNLPRILLYRVAHKYPSIKGYPLISISFAIVAILMSAYVAGTLNIAAKVYEIAFLGVMVSFCVGVVLMRNKPIHKYTPTKFLSQFTINTKNRVIPIIPLVSGIILSISTLVLFLHADDAALLMLTVLFSGILLLKVYFRWGELEHRLATRSDLRLGIGRYSNSENKLPEDLPEYVLCTSGTGTRFIVNRGIQHLLRTLDNKPFELIIFHAEDDKDSEGFFFEQLQRVISQQIAPIYTNDLILTVKILPGTLLEGLQTLKKTYDFKDVLVGKSFNPTYQEFIDEIQTELSVKVHQI